MRLKSPSEPRHTKGFNLFAHDLTISYLARVARIELTQTGIKVRCPTVRLYPCMPLLEEGAFFVFRGIFGMGASDLWMAFFLFGGIVGTNPRPAERAISPSGVPFPAQTRHTESAEQGRT